MIVAEDVKLKRICATGTCVVEPKFVHEAGYVGHIEDVVVDHGLRGKSIGRRIVSKLVDFARACGCYKVILDCAEHNVAFYSKCGFVRKDCSMSCYLALQDPLAYPSPEDSERDRWHIERTKASQREVARSSEESGSLLAREIAPSTTRDGMTIRLLEESDYKRSVSSLVAVPLPY